MELSKRNIIAKICNNMGTLIRLMQFVGCVNVLFIAFNSSYQFSSNYFSNTTMIVTLFGMVVLSFVKDLFSYVGIVKTESKLLYYLFRFVTILIPGILSSFVILIPKLLLIESQHLDSMMVKFTVRVTRLWNKEELSLYLANLVEERGISKLISESDQNHIVDCSSSMGELRGSLNALVNERLEALKSDMTGNMVEAQTVMQEGSWFSENTALVVTVSVIAVVALVGIGYLMYANSGGSELPKPTEPATTGSIDDSSLRGIEDKIAELEALMKSNRSEDMKKIGGMVRRRVEAGLADIQTRSALVSQGKGEIENMQTINDLSDRINELSETVDDLSESLGRNDNAVLGFQTLIKQLREKVNKASAESEQALISVAKLSFGEKGASKIADSEAISYRIDTLSTKLAQQVSAARAQAELFEPRIASLEKSHASVLDSAAVFVKIMVDTAITELKDSDEFVAMGTLLRHGSIHQMLSEVAAEDLVSELEKKE